MRGWRVVGEQREGETEKTGFLCLHNSLSVCAPGTPPLPQHVLGAVLLQTGLTGRQTPRVLKPQLFPKVKPVRSQHSPQSPGDLGPHSPAWTLPGC